MCVIARPMSGSSMVSSQPSVGGSAASLSDRELTEINPGYVPDPEEDVGLGRQSPAAQGSSLSLQDQDGADNYGFEDNETRDRGRV